MLCWAVSRRDRTRETRCQGLGGVWRKGSREAVSRMRDTRGAGAEARGGLESGDEDGCCTRLALSSCEVCANACVLIMAAAPFSSWAAMLLKPRDATRMFWHYVSIPFAKLAHRTWIRPRFDTKYNALQRVAYFSIPVAGLLSVLTGWAIHKSMQLYWLAWIFGGYDKARI